MKRKIDAHLVDVNEKTIAIIDGMPGLNANLNSDQMRSLAKSLITVAEYCDARRGGRTFKFEY